MRSWYPIPVSELDDKRLLGEPFRMALKRQGLYNRPMPFPCNWNEIERVLKKYRGKSLNLGLKSDPFMWMDSKHGHTKRVLLLAKTYDVKFVIHTMSDLIAHDDYLSLVKGHTVVMNLGSGIEEQESQASKHSLLVLSRIGVKSKVKKSILLNGWELPFYLIVGNRVTNYTAIFIKNGLVFFK